MDKYLLCTLLIAQCAVASDDDQGHISLITDGEATSTEAVRAKWCPTLSCPSFYTGSDEDPETPRADLSGESLVDALHERTERSKWCCPLYNRELTRQLFSQLPSDLTDEVPLAIRGMAKCYPPLRRLGFGCEHLYCCCAGSEAAGAAGYTAYAVFDPTCGTISGAIGCAFASLLMLGAAKKQKETTRNLDTVFALTDWSEYEAPSAPVMRESDDDE